MATDAERNRGLGAYSTPGVDHNPDLSPAPIITSAPEVKWRFTTLEPSANLYLTRDDLITLIITNSQPGIEVDIHYRQLLPDGSIHRGFLPFFPTSNRVFNFFSFVLGEGFLLNLSIGASPVSTKRGQCFISVRIAYGTGGTSTTTGVLLSGYISGRTNLVWPITAPDYSPNGPGFIRVIVGTTPAAGAEILETVPTGARWRLRSILYQFTTSATVANRETSLLLDDGANIFSNIVSGFSQAASLNHRYSYSLAVTKIDGAVQLTHTISSPEIILPAGGRIRTSTANLQVGDQYGAPNYQVEEWIEE